MRYDLARRSEAVKAEIRERLGVAADVNRTLVEVMSDVFVAEIYRADALLRFQKRIDAINTTFDEHGERPGIFMSTDERATWQNGKRIHVEKSRRSIVCCACSRGECID